MRKLNLGLVGYGTVGSGVVKLLSERKGFLQKRFDVDFVLKTVCDLYIRKKKMPSRVKPKLTDNFKDIINDKEIDVVIELIGGVSAAHEVIMGALKNGKHVVTANKELLALRGKEIFKEAAKRSRHIYFESSVGAGTPLINSIVDGLAGNRFKGLYGIINGTCNFILTEMTKNNLSFSEALKEAQKRGFAERKPTLDINGMDSVHKLAILVFLTLDRFVDVKDIYAEGISHISQLDIEYAKSLNLTIKLLAIAKKIHNALEIRVHPTLIPNDHPLASINGVFNAIFLDADPLGDVLLAGQGAGQLPAAIGIVSDLIKLADVHENKVLPYLTNLAQKPSKIKLRKIDEVETEYYIRFMVIDKPGVLATISGILGKHGVSIASLSQKVRNKSSAVPIVMLIHHAKERKLRLALEKIYRLSIVRSRPVAIRMEKLQWTGKA